MIWQHIAWVVWLVPAAIIWLGGLFGGDPAPLLGGPSWPLWLPLNLLALALRREPRPTQGDRHE